MPDQGLQRESTDTTDPIHTTLSEAPTFSVFPGIAMQALTGTNLMINRVVIEPGAVVPEHRHPHEQAGYVISGLLVLTVAGERWDLRPGDAYVLPGNTPHSAVTGPDGCVVLDIFSPPREDYLALTT